MTQKILGLDLGTNSIGSSVRNLDLSKGGKTKCVNMTFE